MNKARRGQRCGEGWDLSSTTQPDNNRREARSPCHPVSSFPSPCPPWFKPSLLCLPRRSRRTRRRSGCTLDSTAPTSVKPQVLSFRCLLFCLRGPRALRTLAVRIRAKQTQFRGCAGRQPKTRRAEQSQFAGLVQVIAAKGNTLSNPSGQEGITSRFIDGIYESARPPLLRESVTLN